MTPYEFWMPLVLLVAIGGGGIAFSRWSAHRLHRHDDRRHPAE